ncbi:lactonase family protein [Planctomycetota bacterium]
MKNAFNQIVTLVICLGAVVPYVAAKSMPVYVGTYSEGIYRTVLDLDTGILAEPVLVAQTTRPSFLKIHPNRQFLYCVNEGRRGRGEGRRSVNEGGLSESEGVSAFALDKDTGKLTLLNQQSSGGSVPCHLSIDHTGKYVLVANFGGGSVSVLPIETDGRLGAFTARVQHQGSSVDPRRQRGPQTHSINISPDNRFAFAADLGTDQVFIYRLDSTKGTLHANTPPSVDITPGAGPRHFAFAPNGRFAYVISELNSTITAFSYVASSGTLTKIQSITTLPEDFSGRNSCAEVCVHPSGKFLYGSNRGHNSIVVFQIDPQQGTLTWVEHETAGIETPRNFNIDPTGQFCLVANEDADTIGVFRIDTETGRLESTDHTITIGEPVCVRFLELNDSP